ncbi:MAG TPA: ABC transporter substrate-binding protein [Trebonia sp.]|jgi:NitT/TauT family transport system substrate-binding protein|nr:ABC transporter substrate-binding protein [Trebonia sp.]
MRGNHQAKRPRSRARSALAAGVAVAAALAAAACGSSGAGGGSASGGSASGGGGGASGPGGVSAHGISAARCAQNRAAGTITYLSGYQWQASASILEYAAASKLGYFSDLCLNVALQPGTGDTSQNAKLLASGRVDITPVAEQDLIQAQANGIDIEGVASYSDAGLEILMTNPDVTALSQLNGKIVGDKGSFPATVEAMMIKAGVQWSSIRVVSEGYDPTVLPRRAGGLAALTGFVSNEPNQLKAAGDKVTVWQPVKYGIPSSLASMAVNPAFAKAHPTAVQDLLRAAIHAYDYCSASAAATAQCVGYTAGLSGPTYDTTLNESIWTTETQVVRQNPTPGQPLGGIDPANVGKLVTLLHQYAGLPASITATRAAGWFTNSYIAAIYHNGRLIWPAP